MYKILFKKIFNKESDFSEEELNAINILLEKEILQKDEDEKLYLSSKFKVGTLKAENKYMLFEDMQNEYKNIKLEFEHLNGAYNGDFVIIKRVFNPRSRIKGKVFEVLDSKAEEILVFVYKKQLYTVKESINLNKKASKEYEEFDILLVNSKTFEFKKKIGNFSDSFVDEYISLYLYKELNRLDEEIKINAKMDDTNKRVDLTHLPFCTIDPASAKDHDDAIYYDEEHQTLYVAIADVSYFVKEGSLLDKQAYLKSTSAYFPSKVLPMLPKSLSEDMCSLRENEKRYSYVFEIKLDILNHSCFEAKVYEAIIESKRKFSYGRIDRILNKKFDKYTQIEKEIFDYLLPLYEITKSYRAKRLEKGYEFRSVENRLRLNHKQKLESIEVEESTPSHQLVEECMLLANIEASKKLNGLGIFRIHEEPAFNAITKLIDEVNMLGLNVKLQSNVHDTITHIQQKAKSSILKEEIDELIIHAQTQAKYSSKNLGHFGLGFESYSHFTSPIRRYSDLVLHRILKNKEVPKNIDEICEYISVQERKIDQMVWDFEDRKYARFAKENIGLELKAMITETQKGYAKVYSKLNGMKVHLDNYKGQLLYSKVKIVIKDANIINKQIIASIKY